MTTTHKLKLNSNVLFSNFILTFTWTAFFPVAAAEPVPDPLPPDFASLFILLVLSNELLSSDITVDDMLAQLCSKFLNPDNNRYARIVKLEVCKVVPVNLINVGYLEMIGVVVG